MANHKKQQGTLIKFCHDHNTCYNGKMLPKYCLYGKHTLKGTEIPWYMETYPKNADTLELYVFYNGHWKYAPYDIYRNLFRDVNFYIETENLYGLKTEYTYTYKLKGTFQSTCPTGRKSKITTFRETNKKWSERGDGAGKMSNSGTMLYDTVRNKYGEIEYNFTGKKEPIVYEMRFRKASSTTEA